MISEQSLLSIKQMYKADLETTKNGISSWRLMKNAGRQVGKLALKILQCEKEFNKK